MTTSNNVDITVLDGAGSVVSVAQSKVQALIGVASGGTAAINQVCSSSQPATLATLHGRGPLAEAAALIVLAGGIALTCQIPITSLGTASAVTKTGAGTSVVTTTLDGTVGAYDDYFVEALVITGGTIGTGPCAIQFSLDAGRNYSPTIQLGTANTYVIPGTGITLNFAAGTLIAGNTYTFSTAAPKYTAAGVTAAVDALRASAYAGQWGSIQLVTSLSGLSSSDAATIQTELDNSAVEYEVFTRMMAASRDALVPTAWGGSGETEATWMTAIQTSTSAQATKRIGMGAGAYNIPSPYSVLGTSFTYRRQGIWAVAARVVTIPTQRMASRVRDGQLTNIVVDPVSDPADGFLYHDERTVPGLTNSRFQAFRTRVGKGQGFFLDLPNLMSPIGSQFQFFPQGSVVDVACSITYQTAIDEIDDDLILNTNGTLASGEVRRIQSVLQEELDTFMTANAMCSSISVVVDPTTNVRATGKVVITVTVNGVGYVLEVDASVGLTS
jgi:hypothetical protein